jgi:predicted SAM-dependent methyltransferase
VNIEFGCGETPHTEGYKTCDVRALPGIDFVCNAWEIDKHVEAGSVENIFSRHFFEHLTYLQGLTFIQSCHTILKPGGQYEMLLPNFVWHVRQWLSEANVVGDMQVENPFARGVEGLWGKQRGDVDETWDVHKAGYKEWQIEQLLEQNGFENIEWIDSGIKHYHVKATKK